LPWPAFADKNKHLKKWESPETHCAGNGVHVGFGGRFFFFKKVARAGERTLDLLISFIFSSHHFSAEPQRLPKEANAGS
jgi:hypothetical protein